MSDMDKEMKKKREAMKKRLSSINDSNPVVDKAIKKQDPNDAYEDFDIVNELVSAAMAKYSEDGGSLSQCMKDLGKAIISAASKVSKSNASDNEADY